MLFPHRLTAIADAVHAYGVPLLYDASHVAGLVAEGRFQDPLREGADLVTFSTYKSFGGPAGRRDRHQRRGAGRARLGRRLPGTGRQLRRLPARPAGRRRARARALGRRLRRPVHRQRRRRSRRALDAAGFDVLGAGARLHRVPPRRDRRRRRRHRGRAPPRRGQHPASEIGIPVDPAGGVRIGTQAITRQGFVEEDMPAIADGDRRRAAARPRRARRRRALRRQPHRPALVPDARGSLASTAGASARAGGGDGGDGAWTRR